MNNISKDNVFKLRLEDIPGNNQESLSIYVSELQNHLGSHCLDEKDKEIYSAYLSALKLYQEISNPDGHFLKQSLEYYNKEYQYLKSEFPGIIIEPQGRIKSPLSADRKIRKKIKEYISDGRDLSNLNNSLRDFAAFRYVIKLPDAATLEDACKICYQIVDAQMNFQKKNGFEFIEVGSTKQEQIKNPHKYNKNPDENIYIPKKRPNSIENYDSYFKDYIMYPKETLYQSGHHCAIPPWDKSSDSTIEYQNRTKQMHEYAEKGGASHKNYKSRDFFNRLNIPTTFGLTRDKNNELTDTVGILPVNTSMEKYYGYSFKTRFGIDYNKFLEIFSKYQQNEIWAGTHKVVFEKNTNIYKCVENREAITTIISYKAREISNMLLHKSTEKTSIDDDGEYGDH